MASDSDSVPEPMSGIARERLGRWRYPPRLEPVTIREIVYLRQAPSPHFSPGFVARVRKGGAGKARRTIRPQACFLHSEDRTVRRNAVQRRFYGLAAGSW